MVVSSILELSRTAWRVGLLKVTTVRRYRFHGYVALFFPRNLLLSWTFGCLVLLIQNLVQLGGLNSEPSIGKEELGGGTNPCDVGLDLSGSWQQGHSATYNAPSRI